MEIVAVTSAIYGLVLSMVICVVAVAIFSGHLVLLVITVVTMLGMTQCSCQYIDKLTLRLHLRTQQPKKLDQFYELITFSSDELEMCFMCHFVAKIV